MLSPGGTEAEGSSDFKVCPYTYCFLNGHRDTQLPPLKRIVAARRRLLKAQKSAKVVLVRPASFCRGSLADKPASRDGEFETDFFVKIYAKGKKDGSSNSGGEAIKFSEESEDTYSCLGLDEGDALSLTETEDGYDKVSPEIIFWVVVHEVGLEDEERTRATEQASDRKIPTHPQIAGTSSEDSTIALSQGLENEESIRLIKISANYSGDADNLEGYRTDKLDLNEDLTGPSKEMEKNSRTRPLEYATTLMSTMSKTFCSRHKGKPREDLTDPGMIWRIDRREKFDVSGEDLPGFNPRDPNYLPIIHDPEAEKVDLRRQMIDDRRNLEEWVIDYAFRQAVSKLNPARKKKVELLVEAFEMVTLVAQFETHIKSSSTGITHGRPHSSLQLKILQAKDQTSTIQQKNRGAAINHASWILQNKLPFQFM